MRLVYWRKERERKHMKKVVYLVIANASLDSAYEDYESAEARSEEIFNEDVDYVTEEYDLDSSEEDYAAAAGFLAGYDGDNAYVATITNYDPDKPDKTYVTDEGDEVDGYEIAAALRESELEDEEDDMYEDEESEPLYADQMHGYYDEVEIDETQYADYDDGSNDEDEEW